MASDDLHEASSYGEGGMKMLKWWVSVGMALIVGLVFASFSRAEVSGVYLELAKNSLLFVHIVKGPEGQVSGRMEVVSVRDDGSIQNDSVPLQGYISGHQLNLKANVLLGFGPTMSGQVDGNALRLVTDNGQSILYKSNFDKFASEKARLMASGKAVAQAKRAKKTETARRDFLTNLSAHGVSIDQNLSKGLKAVEDEAEAYLTATVQNHDRIIKAVETAKRRWRVSNDEGRTVLEGEIAARSGDTIELRAEFETKGHEIAQQYDELQVSLTNFRDGCLRAHAENIMPLPNECSSATTYLEAYEQSRTRLREKFDAVGERFNTGN